MAWPHLSAWAMGCVDDPAEGGTAAAAINTVQLICGAFGAGLAGVVVNMTDRGDATRGAVDVRRVRRRSPPLGLVPSREVDVLQVNPDHEFGRIGLPSSPQR